MRKVSAKYRDRKKLPDGRNLQFRAIRPSDRDRLREAFHRLSPASVRERFFNMKLDLTPRELTFFTEVDFVMHVALVAEIETGNRLEPAAVGRFVRRQDQPDHCEFAITVADEMQGLGIGKLMLWQLIDCARALGVRTIEAALLPQNGRMLHLLRGTGLPLSCSAGEGILTCRVDIEPRLEAHAG